MEKFCVEPPLPFVAGNVGAMIGNFNVGQAAFSLALSDDNQSVYVGCRDGQIQKWLCNTESEAATFQSDLIQKPTQELDLGLPSPMETETLAFTSCSRRKVTAISALNKTGTMIGCGFDNGDVHIVCSESQKCLKLDLAANEGPILGLFCIPEFLCMEGKENNKDEDIAFSLLITTKDMAFVVDVTSSAEDDNLQSPGIIEFDGFTSSFVSHGEPACFYAGLLTFACETGCLIQFNMNRRKQKKVEIMQPSRSVDSNCRGLKAMASTVHQERGLVATLSQQQNVINIWDVQILGHPLTQLNLESPTASLTFAHLPEKLYLVTAGLSGLTSFVVTNDMELESKGTVEVDPIEDLCSPAYGHGSEYFVCKSNYGTCSLRSVKGTELRRFGSSVLTSMASEHCILNISALTGDVSISDCLSCVLSPQRFLGHSGLIRFVHCHRSKSESHLISCATDKTTKVWEIESNSSGSSSIASSSSDPLVSVVILQAESIILALSQRGILSLWTPVEGDLWQKAAKNWSLLKKATSLSVSELQRHEDCSYYVLVTTSFDNVTLWLLSLNHGGGHDATKVDKLAFTSLHQANPVCCTLLANRINMTKWWLSVAVGLDNGHQPTVMKATLEKSAANLAFKATILPPENPSTNQSGPNSSLLRTTSVFLKKDGITAGHTSFGKGQNWPWYTSSLCLEGHTPAAAVEEKYICGDIKGQIHFCCQGQGGKMETKRSQSGHKNAITGLASFKGGNNNDVITIVSSAKDGLVKLWEFVAWDSPMTQIGEFQGFSGSPLTCLAAAGNLSSTTIKTSSTEQSQRKRARNSSQKMDFSVLDSILKSFSTGIIATGDKAGQLTVLYVKEF
jgi:hypothetical protein